MDLDGGGEAAEVGKVHGLLAVKGHELALFGRGEAIDLNFWVCGGLIAVARSSILRCAGSLDCGADPLRGEGIGTGAE